MDKSSQRKIIEDKIANLKGNDFQDFCDRLFITLFPDDYTPVRAGGPTGDLKNDGYCPKQSMYIAAHATRGETTAKIMNKIESDLEGCIVKHQGIKKWIYITNDILIGSVQKFIEDQRLKHPEVEIETWGPSIIAKKILPLDKDIINYITDIDIYTDIEQIIELLKPIVINKEDESKEIASSIQSDNKIYIKPTSVKVNKLPKKNKSIDYQKLMTLYSQGYSKKNFVECKKILYSSSDSEAVIQAHLMLASWYEYSPETVEDQNTLLDIGIASAHEQNALDVEAILLATKGVNLSTQFVLMDLEGWGLVEMGNRIGFPLITPEKHQEIIQKLNILDAQFKKLFKTATEKSVESNNYLVISRVLSMLGSAAGERALHFLTLKINDRAEIEKKLCKGAFMCSKGLLIKTQDQGELALLMHNFANSLRNIGETEEALDLVVKSIKIAKKLNIPDFIDKAEKLKDRIIHPVEIPSIK